MDREILLGITGMQWEMMDDGEQKAEDAEAVEMLTSADYFFKNGKHYLLYDIVDSLYLEKQSASHFCYIKT